MTSLYALTAELAEALDAVYVDDDGNIQGLDYFQTIGAEVEAKNEAVALYIKDLLSDANEIANEIKALDARKKAKANKADRLLNYLDACLKVQGRAEFETPRCKVSYRASQSVEIMDYNLLPDEFIRVKTEPNKDAIKKALKGGEAVPGAQLIDKDNIQLK